MIDSTLVKYLAASAKPFGHKSNEDGSSFVKLKKMEMVSFSPTENGKGIYRITVKGACALLRYHDTNRSIKTLLDDFRDKIVNEVKTSIDAGACGTSRDHDKWSDCSQELSDVEEKIEELFDPEYY